MLKHLQSHQEHSTHAGIERADEMRGRMPRYYFHVQNGNGYTADEEGIDLEDAGSARAMAMDSIRSMVAEEARKGVLDLDGFVDVLDQGAVRLTRIGFPEAFAIRLPMEATGA
jgi:hypothetical protein